MRTRLLFIFLASCGAEPADELRWYTTCGDPACAGYAGPTDGLPQCTEEVEGEPCSDAAARCDPEDACNTRLICATEDPKQGEGGCPISRRAYKHDVRYLDPAAVERVRKDALDLPLATWRYNGAPASDPPRLGFVIEDRPASPAVSPDGAHVDVYALAAMAIATAQAQEREIAALRARIDALEAARR